jgi:small-conductance mechanosensitive channel
MKTTSIKWIIPLLIGVLIALNCKSQDSIKASVDSLLKKEVAADSGSNNIITKNVKDRQVNSDSSKISNDSSKLDREEKETKTPALDEKKVIKQAEEVGAAGENKIEELSNLISRANIFYTIVFLLFGFVVIKVITFILNALAERSTKYRIAFKGSIPIVKIIGWVIIITLVIVVIFKPSVASMLAVSASIGVAIGFASQDILKNIFGGVVILLDRPFVSGDKIEVDKYYGEVVEIGLRSTRIVTPDDSLVSVPNAVMMSSSLSNSNAGEPNCQVVAEIYLPLTIDTIKTREIATQAATVSKYIYLGKPITVLFINEINQHHSYYKMKVKAYVMDIRHEFTFKSDMTELIIKELLKEGMINGEF